MLELKLKGCLKYIFSQVVTLHVETLLPALNGRGFNSLNITLNWWFYIL